MRRSASFSDGFGVDRWELGCRGLCCWSIVWDGVHWDFMLEHGEVLRTWAIDAPIVAGSGSSGPGAWQTIGGSTWNTRGRSQGTAGGSGGWTQGPIDVLVWSADRVRVVLAGSQLVGEVDLRRIGPEFGRRGVLDLPHGKLGLKHLARGQDGSVESPLGPIGPAREPDLAGADLKFFELHVLALDVRRITHEDHGIAVLSRPLDVNTMVACILDDPVENIVGGDRQDPGADLLEVSSTVFPSGTRGRATTVITDSTPPWSELKGERDRSSSNSTRGSLTSGGSWSAKWVTRSSASQALTSWSEKTASQLGSLQISLRS